MFTITNQDPNLIQARTELMNVRAGAYVSFEGWVRNHHEGKNVVKLEYEAFKPLCIKEANKIREEALNQFDIIDIHCIHRIGECYPGTLAVWIGVTAEHRGDAFKACEYYIDQLKLRVPIWKKETYQDGNSTWVQCACVAHDDHTHKHDHSHKHTHSH